LDFSESQRSDVDEGHKEETEKRFRKPAPIELPYVKGIPERVARMTKRHRVLVTMKPVKILRRLLVHPKDKQEKKEITDCVYKIPCGN